MEKIVVGDPETRSADAVADNLERLQALFPEAFSEGKVDFEVFRQLLGGAVDESEEKYGLNWHGKRRARQLALTPSTGTLRPCPEDSVHWDRTQNLVVEGDNLEVLKLLQKSYASKVKLIYIDPPYNTGKDFVYPDNFHDSIKNYLQLTGQVESEKFKVSSNTESSGRFHTNWLNMIFPRVKLARNLLREDGIIVVSVDDTEFPTLRRVFDEIFGEENFIATLVYDRNRKNDARYFSVGHEYMLVYFKDEQRFSDEKIVLRGSKEGVDELREVFDRLRNEHADDWDRIREGIFEYYASFDEDDPRTPLARFRKVDEKGPYRDDGNINWPGGNGLRYEVEHPITKRPCKQPVSGWRYPTPERFWEEVESGRVVFGRDETTVPRVRTNIFEKDNQVMVSVHYSYAQTSANQFSALFDERRVFDNPKPVSDLGTLISYFCGPDDLVMDFFAGSGTTGHAVLSENTIRGMQRRYLLVQLPDKLTPRNSQQKIAAEFLTEIDRPLNVAEITKERLRRVGTRLRNDHPSFKGDLGFRVFKLDTSNIRAWDPNPDGLEGALLAGLDHIEPGRTEQDILYELLLKLGLDLCVPIETQIIADKSVHAVGAGTLITCLDKAISRGEVEPLALGIADWHDTLSPAGETTVVFRDSAFADDIAKTNLAAILEQRGLGNVRSL